MKHYVATVVFLVVVPHATARAQGSYHSTPNGGQTALMGNTGVALGHDGSAPFLNPATIVDIQDFKLAFSMNFYAYTSTRLNNYHQPGAVDGASFPGVASKSTTVSDNTFDVVPSTLCFFFTLSGSNAVAEEKENIQSDTPRRRGRQKLAMCLGNVERRSLSLPALNFREPTATGFTQQAGSLTRKWNRVRVGPSYAGYITDNLAVGLSIHGVYNYYGFHDDSSTVTTGGPTGTISSSVGASGAGHSIDLDAIVGMTYKAGRYTLGLSAATPSLHVTGGLDANLYGQVSGTPAANAYLSTGSGNLVTPSPVRLSAGVAVDARKNLKVEIDASYHFPLSGALRSTMRVDQVTVEGAATTPSSFDATYAVRARPVLNFSGGGEYFLTPAVSVLAGVSTDISATPALDSSTSLGAFYKERLNRVTVSGGIGSYGEGGDLMIGTQLHYGWGQALALNSYVLPSAYSIIDVQQYGALLILAGSTNFKTISRAVEKVEDMVKGKPAQDEPKPEAPAPLPP